MSAAPFGSASGGEGSGVLEQWDSHASARLGGSGVVSSRSCGDLPEAADESCALCLEPLVSGAAAAELRREQLRQHTQRFSGVDTRCVPPPAHGARSASQPAVTAATAPST